MKTAPCSFASLEKPISLDEVAKKYGTYNKNLDKAVAVSLQKTFPKKPKGGIEILDAHSCLYAGKRFAHVALRYQNRTVSALVTDTDLPAAEMGAATDSETIAGMRVTGFHAAHYAIFVVSDLPEKDNAAVAQAVYLPSELILKALGCDFRIYKHKSFTALRLIINLKQFFLIN